MPFLGKRGFLVSYICDTSEEAVRRVRRSLPQVPATAQRSVPDQDANAVQTSRTVEEVTLDESVCRVFDADSVDFSDITVDHVLGQLDVSTPASHGRTTAYFGSTSYSYGPIRHMRLIHTLNQEFLPPWKAQ